MQNMSKLHTWGMQAEIIAAATLYQIFRKYPRKYPFMLPADTGTGPLITGESILPFQWTTW